MAADESAAMPESTPWFTARVLSRDPFITFSSAELDKIPLVLLAAEAPELFDVPKALHLLHITHSIEAWQGADRLAAEIARAQAVLPGHTFLVLTATEMEAWLLARRGVPSLQANGVIFTDERIWKPTPPMIPGLRVYDAVYSARLAPGKRHELASAVASLLLVYAHALSHSEQEAHDRVRALLPNAYFANHELGKGKYRKFDIATMVRLMGHANVGLCLSAAEGSPRASMEYMLCGLPVVSTRSIGGRDRYYIGKYCRVVADDPDAIAGAVRELADMQFDRRRVRAHIAELLVFDRYNFLFNANKIAKAVLGSDNLLPSIDPLLGAVARFDRLDRVVDQFRALVTVPAASVSAPEAG